MISKDSGQCQECDELFAGFLNASEKKLAPEKKSPEPAEDWFQLPNGKFLHLATISSVRCIEEMYGHGVDIFTSTGPQQWEFKSKPDQVKFKQDLDQAREAYHKRMKIPIPEEAAPFVCPPRIPPGRVMKPKDKTEDLEVSFEPDGPDGHEKWRLDLHDLIDDHEHYTDKIEWDSDSVPKLREQVQDAIEYLQTMDHFLIDVQSAAKLRNREKRIREAAEANANKKPRLLRNPVLT